MPETKDGCRVTGIKYSDKAAPDGQRVDEIFTEIGVDNNLLITWDEHFIETVFPGVIMVPNLF